VNFSAIRDKVATESVRLAPKGVYSEAIGWGARRTVPRLVRAPLYAAFARLVGAELDEVELPLHEYRTLGSFFSRRLRDDARTVAAGEGVAVSPCDGRIAAAGCAARGRLIQAKGHEYSLEQLLVDPDLAGQLEDGEYVTIYLSPRDYHRVHSPCSGEIIGYDYVPGSLFPVSPKWAARVPDLFARNERIVLHLQTQLGRIALVMVGATGVGNMALAFAGVEARDFRRARPRRLQRVRYDAPRPRFHRGDELGCFQLGSTVIVVFEPHTTRLAALTEGVSVRFGQPIANARTTRREGAVA
jgi:phosphatidylserine decarboxylase